MLADWNQYRNFKKHEFDCKHTGKNEMNHFFMLKLQALRTECGFPFIITSGYRDKTHPVEVNKKTTGTHVLGCAADVAIDGHRAYRLLQLAFKHGIIGIGVNQKGDGRFIHLDTAPSIGHVRPIIFSY